MTGILDTLITKPVQFRPQSVEEYVALQLARKLGDPDGVRRYLAILERFPFHMVTGALIKAQTQGEAESGTVKAFHEELAAQTSEDDGDAF